ncbi:MAG TPA: helix-turn-helix domain-containing protein [Phenylobacterium sp.]|nr:helix-turn-helix domain-containing protein [Phenylobacterium sp.]
MSEDIYTVEQFAERLKLHPKTVLRFIREGRLRAVKVGRAYRILRSDMEAFGVVAPRSNAARVRVTSIVDVPDISPERAQHLARLITSARMGGEAQPDPMHIDVAHDPHLRQVKVVLVGSPIDVSAMLRMVALFLEPAP